MVIKDMRRLVTSDLQLADNDRDRYRIDFVKDRLPKLLSKYKPDQLLVLGDLCESKDNHPASLVNEIVEIFVELAKHCPVIFLEGNHDRLDFNHPFFEFLQRFENVTWIRKPAILDNCLYLPHTRDYKKDWKGINFSGHDYIFTHNIWSGARGQNGHSLGGFPLSIFPDDAVVVSGDVHEPQSFGCCTYVGSPTLCDFGEDYQPRVLLLDDQRMVSIKVSGPQKRLVVVKWLGEPNHWHDVISSSANPQDIVKIQAQLEMKHVAEWDKIRNLLAVWAMEKEFIVNTIQPVVSYKPGNRMAAQSRETRSDSEYLDSYAQRRGLDGTSIAAAKEIIQAVDL